MRKHSITLTILFAMCFSILLLVCTLNPAEARNKPEAVNGVLDLTHWDWEQDGIVALDGQWEFYWQELLTPGDFFKANSIIKKDLITVPRAWNRYVINGEELSGDGYATYRLLVNTSGDALLGIKIPRIFTSYNLWVNGELVASNGIVAADKGQMVPQYLPMVRYIRPASTLEIVIQVANYRHRSGGILESLRIGTEAQITHLRTSNLTFELFLFGSLFIIGFYHFGLFIFRTKDRSTLYFSIYSVLIGLRTLLVGEIYFIHLFPNFSWEIAHKVQTLAYYLGIPLFFLFLRSIFPKDISSKINTLVQVVGLSFACVVLVMPAKIFSHLNPFFQIFTLILVPYILYVLFSISKQKREGSYLITIGALILILFTINDIIFLSIILSDADAHFLRDYISRGNLSSWGLLGFVFAQSLVLAKKSSKSFTKVEKVTEQLQQLNENLEEKVRDRTQALETSKKELEEAYQAVSRSEKSRQHLVQNISHDLRTPLTSIKGYVNAILDGIVKEPEQRKKYLGRVIDKVEVLDHMVQHLMELSQLESRQLRFNFKLISLKILIENITEKYCFDLNVSKVKFNINYPSNWPDHTFDENQLYVKADMEQLGRVFANLFSNALNHTPAAGRIDLNFDLTDDRQTLVIEIADTGTGIPKEDIAHIFERFYMVEKARQTNRKNSGLGLAIAKEIVEYHDGQLWVKSEIGKGSNFFFTLPLQDRIRR